ncbi:hypothetical protein LTR56_006460 [Elasticomyces elasticus]|nr:hypothetical protein LTR22_012966 [Elasticomyces elasticus]KAK3650185.1 hypothetical protein LTR56_006460 [Elasticomyces elasticus]KAK4927040.1 hypothetical protein LTR49_006197 [Elasticomyces elasticus]KAK5764367.1 hypothetical protein LTS12_005580 [Elasticomyces elasticus]
MIRHWHLRTLVTSTILRLATAQNNYACPANNGQTVTDSYGVQYIIGCSNDTTQGNYAASPVSSSFNDCMNGCSIPSFKTSGNAGNCTAVTYQGGTNGVGSGNCFYKNFNGESFTSGNPNLVGLIRVAYYSAATVSTPSTPAFNGPSWTCPAQNYTLVTDPNGVQYVIGCGTDTSMGSYASYTTMIGFDDCFSWCSNGTYPTTAGAGHCSAFTFVGPTNGVGQGTCYYKNGATESFSGSASNFVAAIRYDAYSGTAPTATLGGSGSSASSSSNAAAVVASSATKSKYVVACNQTYQGVVGQSQYEPNMLACINSCSADNRCIGVGYNTTSSVCDDYYAYVMSSAIYSKTQVFAQMQQRAVRYGNGQTTTEPISTSYVPSTAVTTPRPPSVAISTSLSMAYTPTPLSLSSSINITNPPTASPPSTTTLSTAIQSSYASSQAGDVTTFAISSTIYSSPSPSGVPPQLSLTSLSQESSVSFSAMSNNNNTTAFAPVVSQSDNVGGTSTSSTSASTGLTSSSLGVPSSTSSGLRSQIMTSSTTQSVSLANAPEFSSFALASPESKYSSQLSFPDSSTLPGALTSAGAGSSMSTSASLGYTSSSLLISSSTPTPVSASPTAPTSGTQVSSASMSVATLSPSASVCPAYNGQNVTDSNNATYTVQCDTIYKGTVIQPGRKRDTVVAGYSILACTGICDANAACVGLVLTVDGTCKLFDAITNYLPGDGLAALPNARAVIVPGTDSVSILALPDITTSGKPGIQTSTQSTTSPANFLRTSIVAVATTDQAAANGTMFPASSAVSAATSTATPFESIPHGHGPPMFIDSSSMTPVAQSSIVNIVTIFVTPSTCNASPVYAFGTSTTYTTVTVVAVPTS